MPEVLFVKTVPVHDEDFGTDKQKIFLKDHVYDLSEESVKHWTDRNAATVNPERIQEAKDNGAEISESPMTGEPMSEEDKNAAVSVDIEEEHPTNDISEAPQTATSTPRGGSPQAPSAAGPGADITAGAGVEGKNDKGQEAVTGPTNPGANTTPAKPEEPAKPEAAPPSDLLQRARPTAPAAPAAPVKK